MERDIQINGLASIWQTYRNTIFKNCTTPTAVNEALSYWRDNLFASTVMYLIPLSFIALIPGIYLAYLEGLTFLVLADLIAMMSLLLIAFAPIISVYIRKLLFFAVLYQVSIALLFYLGTFGPGLMYLLAITVFVVLIFEKEYGIGTVILNTFVCILFGFAIHFEWWENAILSIYEVRSWVAVSSNLVFLSLLAVLLIPKLFNGLQTTIDEQNRLRNELENNQRLVVGSLNQLEEKNRELEDFAHAASHDLKEPLRMIRSFLKLLDQKYSDKLDEKAHKYIHFAVNGVDRMKSLIEELLEYTRVDRKYTSFENVDLNKVLDEIKLLYIDEIEKGATIEYSTLPHIVAVPVTLRMLFQNLISNALKYQRPGSKPRVEISFEDLGTHWQFKVSDNGIGINSAYFEEIFQLFKRLHPNDLYSGSGMGLAICKKIVNQHDGKIWVESLKGIGTTFIFTIEKDSS